MQERLEKIRSQALEAIKSASSEKDLENIRIRVLGRKGKVTSVLKAIGKLSAEERPKVGQLANKLKKELEAAINDRKNALKDVHASAFIPGLDPTLPGRQKRLGRLHPITQVMNQICSVFERMGFTVVQGPEVELDFYNFEALNIPPDHPARDMQDTFYIDDKVLLRTHTSPIQIRAMERQQPPIRVIAPGKVYRCDSDITHTPMFHQVEGLMVDRDVSFAGLKGVLTAFVQQIFDTNTLIRFRPSFFPFTEPSAEIDIQCVICKGKGCRICSQTGWLEVLGAGMVHPEVFRHVGYDAEQFSGFAFGLGVERIAMLKFGIDDIRLFYDNDLRFLHQF
ncbi:MAG: phenylalanine--tRNA ligase subunit alpha [delta proteobacterium ML8_D]|jgi:phenylalanyl-tRNA synthetase alpha chain|nr:MAG: phenylalanine--tRNA ligase subunit alpha [delta proteobacterium ML8_D]